jgi:hypothetical protein
MGWTVQIDPTSETWHISGRMYLAIEPLLRDYDMRYCYIRPSQQALEVVRSLAPTDFEEARVIGHVLDELQRRKRVELLFGN